MSQILTQRSKNYILYSELTFQRNTIQLKSSAKEAICQICKSELKEGNSLVARCLGNKMVLVCSSHKI